MKKKEKIKELEAESHALIEIIQRLNNMITFLEQTLESCENACQYHQERSEKAFEIIGRLMVEGELDAEAIQSTF